MRRLLLSLCALVGLWLIGVGTAGAKPPLAEVTERAEKGNAKAQFTLGEIYANGDGVVEDPVEAVRWYQKSAAQDYTRAQAALGYMYSVGHGVGKDSAEAVRWFRLAAEKGHATAQYNLGIKYQTGDGVEKDSAEAAKWYLLAADQGTGHAKARYNLGVMYATGDGVPKDPLEAVLWYRKAAELNYAKAQANLGFMYATGDGVRRDPAEAVAWYRKAADQGDATALYNLGVMAAVGDGVPKDLVQAHVWMKEAGAQGDKNARPNLEAIEQKMTAEQKAEAQQLTSTARKAEHKARPSGWYAKFRPGAGARLRFQADGRCTTAEEGAFCRFGIWVAAAGPEAEVELLPTAEDPAAADAKLATYRAIVLQRSDEMVVLKVVTDPARQEQSVEIFTVFPKTGLGFVTICSADGQSRVDPRNPGAADTTKAGASGSVTPLVRAD